MRLESIRLRGFGIFRDEVYLDLSNVRGVIALVGENGAGKSTLVECWGPGALYREIPTYGSLSSLAISRDALLEARVVNGQPWTIRHTVDAVSAKGESVVLDAEGRPAFESAKVRAFDQWSQKHLPPPEVFFSTVFQPQGASGFLGMTPSERKAVLLRVLGIERYEAMAARHRERAREWSAKLDTLHARIGDLRESLGISQSIIEAWDKAHPDKPWGVIGRAELELAERQVACASAQENLSVARSALAQAQVEAEASREARRNYDAAIRMRAELQTKIEGCDQQLADLEERIRNNRDRLAEAEQIRAAVEKVTKLEAELAALEKAQAVDEQKRLACGREADGHKASADAAHGRGVEAQARVERLRKRLAERPKAQDAAEQLPAAAILAEECELSITRIEQRIDELGTKRLAGAEDRIRGLRGGLIEVTYIDPELPAEAAQAIAGTTLQADDELVEEAKAVPEAIQRAQRELSDARERLGEALRKRQELERLAQSLAEFDRVQADIDAATHQAEQAFREENSARAAELDTRQRARELARRVGEHRTAADLTREQLKQLGGIAGRAGPLANAEARLAELEPRLAAVKVERDALAEQLAATPEPVSLPPPAPELAPLESTLAQAEEAARRTHAAVAVAEQALETAKAAAIRLAELEAQRAEAETELADWNRLAADCGRDGLQALEIDDAGPELTRLINDMLHRCYGPRFTVRIDTQRLGADKRLLEGCGLTVIDSERGREADGSKFCGGEKVILGEATSLGLSMLACKRAGVRDITLVRDESGAALSANNAPVYMRMLRHAMQEIGAAHVLFVTHDPQLWELADARIEVANGKVTLS